MDNREVMLIDSIDKAKKDRLEKLLLKNNISYFERSKGDPGFFSKSANRKYSIYVHIDSLERAKSILEEM
ncbi:MAG: hypothetical protein PUD90_01050 [Clostridia bacterium]|nr:hypothetical protein [Clostridia bacterium]